MSRWLAMMLLVPGLASAQAWQGIWAADPEWCAVADQIGAVTPAPIELSAAQMRGYENTCEMTSVDPVDGMTAWILRAACLGEGSSYDMTRLVMVDADTLWMWFGDSAPIPFTRCAP